MKGKKKYILKNKGFYRHQWLHTNFRKSFFIVGKGYFLEFRFLKYSSHQKTFF